MTEIYIGGNNKRKYRLEVSKRTRERETKKAHLEPERLKDWKHPAPKNGINFIIFFQLY